MCAMCNVCKSCDFISNDIGLPAISAYYVHMLETIHVDLSPNDFMKEFGDIVDCSDLYFFVLKVGSNQTVLFSFDVDF